MDLNTEHRANCRTPCNEDIHLTITNNKSTDPKKNRQTVIAKVMDISATGMGIASNLKLSKNQFINFDQNQPNWQLPEKGIVVWSYKHDSNYRAGLEFIIPEGQ